MGQDQEEYIKRDSTAIAVFVKRISEKTHMEEQKDETIRMYVSEEPEKSKRYSFHMNSLKWLLAIVLIALMSTTLGIL